MTTTQFPVVLPKTPWRRHNFRYYETKIDCPSCLAELLITVAAGPSGEQHVIKCCGCACSFLVVR